MRRPVPQPKPAPPQAVDPLVVPPRFNWATVSALVLVLLTTAGGLWWMCARSEAIAFLTTRAGAEWIVFPRYAEITPHAAESIAVEFRHSFNLTAQPANATLTVCAFRDAAIDLNGRKVGSLPGTGRNWKLPSSVEVAGLLQPGTNVITTWVTNAVGPSALWLLLKGDVFSIGTAERWQVSLDGREWQDARFARQPMEFQADSSRRGDMQMLRLLKHAWPVEAAFCAVSLALVWGLNHWLRHKRLLTGTLPTTTATKLIYGLLVIVLIARTALFVNNLLHLPRLVGFDAVAHEDYIKFIQQKHALPLADDGFEMNQPPLYYAAAALLLDICGRSAGDGDAVYFLRAVNGAVGLLHCWVVLLCLRLLFRGNPPAQAAGLLVAAFLPPNLYLSQYVTNEPLAAFLVTVAIYFCLRVLRAEKEGLWMPVGIGAALGAAMLAKFSVLLALPFFPAALSQRLVAQKGRAGRDWLRGVGAVAVVCLIVCGWHYGRVWARFGKPNVWNWDPQAGQAYWQDPGFRTGTYYSSFGRVLTWPWYSAFHSYADGIYSTLWGDGLASGACGSIPPPWNYDLMGAGYWISLGVSLLVIIGSALVLASILHQARGEWLLVFGMVCIFGLGLVWMSLVLPSYMQAKAFYALPALFPFSALAAVGWNWLRQRHHAIGSALWVLLLVWSMTVYASFWVRGTNPATQVLRGFELGSALMAQGKLDEAIRQFQEVIRLKPDHADAHNDLGLAFDKQGQTGEAIRQFQEAIRLKPDHDDAHYNLGNLLLRAGQIDDAIRQYQEVIRFKPDYALAYNNLGAAFTQKGQADEAVRYFQEFVRLRPDQPDGHNNLGTALGLKGQTEEAIRQFQEALRIKPDYADARRNLAIALAAKGGASPPPGAGTNR
jgi:tetratricopeptide (TPR) repeat protein